ncbi:hypothetical protein [Okeania sp. SIO2B9]|uniref:hypothetical protein n=1 Tax=Okeania sp. SIO2B9 TaxID=2607782 RepID=UPI00142C6F3E|nr:hypothetical protein [Okeania sp. SIO2B9]NES92059.1 hypothetical protein [Okeania sp. SIO2B9]
MGQQTLEKIKALEEELQEINLRLNQDIDTASTKDIIESAQNQVTDREAKKFLENAIAVLKEKAEKERVEQNLKNHQKTKNNLHEDLTNLINEYNEAKEILESKYKQLKKAGLSLNEFEKRLAFDDRLPIDYRLPYAERIGEDTVILHVEPVNFNRE